MKITRYLLLILIVFWTINSYSETFINFSRSKTEAVILTSSPDRLHFKSSINGMYVSSVKTRGDSYTRLRVPGYYPDNSLGNPELPVYARLIEVPRGSRIEINIISYEIETIDLKEFEYFENIYPNQASLFKNQDPSQIPFEKNVMFYENQAHYSPKTIQVKHKGVMRGVKLAQLIINPFEYNPASNTITVKTEIEAEIIFRDADHAKTEREKINKYSPLFAQSYNLLWNYREPQNKGQISKYPIKYVIISDRMFENALQDFVRWKSQKGFYVIEAYTDEIGYTKEEIKSFLQDLYDSGTANDPAPTYALFVGDTEQVPTFTVQSGFQTHASDMYYCEFDGNEDYIPDMYFGRFSANNVQELLPQIEKTIMFEKFTFPDPEFIAEAVLVSGHDNNFGTSHGNGQINYAVNYYFNEDRGVIDHTYLHPESNSQASLIIADISNGVGFVNYTAHCGASGWSGPSFTVSDIPGLQNENKYFFSIGNCCQSNRFDSPNPSFGEALLRADKKGAVVHIGGSNNTMWDEDFYWSVGITELIQEFTTYEESTTAAYDHLFHENDEEPYVTAYQMIFRGNMEVMASTSNQVKYYWEIYHVMGDPSLMPYVGYTPQIHVEYEENITLGANTFTVITEPDAYVAISIDGMLLDAKLSGSNGEAILVFDPVSDGPEADIVVTKQFRAPHIGTVNVIPNENEYDALMKSVIFPEDIIHVSQADFSPSVEIMNVGQTLMVNAKVGYIFDETEPVEIIWIGALATLESETVTFPEISLEDGIYIFTAYINDPNGQTDQNPENTQITKDVMVYSGNVKILEINNPPIKLCNETVLSPEISIKNLDNHPLTSLKVEYSSGSIQDVFMWTGEIAPGESKQIVFPQMSFPAGLNNITFTVSEPNGGTNLYAENTLSKDFYVIPHAHYFELDLLTDIYGDENSWELIDHFTEVVLYDGGPYPSGIEEHYIYTWCLGPGCYTFTIYDSYGDGMSGAWWLGDPGHVTIINTETQEIILDLEGDDENFTFSYSVTFCVEEVLCPENMLVSTNTQAFTIFGQQPEGGVFSGTGIIDDKFHPEIAGEGEHLITYEYTFPTNEEPSNCSFYIAVQDIKCPDNMTVFTNDEAFTIEGQFPIGGEFSGVGIDNGIFDPEVAGEGIHYINYKYILPLSQQELNCTFIITVEIFEENYANINNIPEIKIFPNPTTGEIFFKNIPENDVNIEIYNVTGQLIKKTLNVNNKIDISGFPVGYYIMRIYGEDYIAIRKINLIY